MIIYKYLYEKYLINNNKASIGRENSVFSTLLNFSAELSFNIMSLLIILGYRDYYPFSSEKNLIFFIVIPMLIGLLISFIFLKRRKLNQYIDNKISSNSKKRTLVIIYSVLSYVIVFICLIS